METLQLLGVALGLATLAGLNLYLTVFVTGLAVNQNWILLADKYQQLELLGEPVIIVVAGVLYFVEFFADKVPWVDSLWDSIHTVIRPIGGALLAIRVLGPTHPVFDVLVALLAGSAALVAHSAKAGTRLVANGSPEPFSNIALSVTEDVAVLAGLALINFDPVIALLVFTLIIGCIVWFAPRLFRGTRVILWLAWKKLTAPAGEKVPSELPSSMPSEHDLLFSRMNPIGEKIVWAVPCVSAPALPANFFGTLIATEEEPQKLYFVAPRRIGKLAVTIDIEGYKVAAEPKFFSHNLVLYSADRKPERYVFIFDRPRAGLVEAVAESIRERAAAKPAPASLSDLVPREPAPMPL